MHCVEKGCAKFVNPLIYDAFWTQIVRFRQKERGGRSFSPKNYTVYFPFDFPDSRPVTLLSGSFILIFMYVYHLHGTVAIPLWAVE